MLDKIKLKLRCNIIFSLFLAGTIFLMLFSIIWVYHFKVLNAPKVYSDGFGYFVYLPAVLYHDFNFQFVEGWEHPLSLTMTKGGMINRYPIGTAIMESPFFFAAHLLSLLRDALTGSTTATGYSNLYQYFILFGGVLYWAIGTIMLYSLLIHYLGISKKNSCITCILITFGTNLFHYASYDACFSHIYSYTLFITFLYYLCWYEEREKDNRNHIWHTCFFGVLAGLIFMVRNTNILFVLTYILYGVKDWKSLKDRVATVLNLKRAMPIILTGSVCIVPQLMYWHTATGHWFVDSYGSNSQFYWLSPELFNFLFSIRKGLFFWNPILLISIIGMIVMYKQRKNLYIGLVIFFIAIIYLSSSWWMWYYGGSYGCRVAVDFMCVFAIFIAYMLDYLDKRQKPAAIIALYGYSTLCVAWNLIMTAAYWYKMIPSDGATWEHIKAAIEWVL